MVEPSGRPPEGWTRLLAGSGITALILYGLLSFLPPAWVSKAPTSVETPLPAPSTSGVPPVAGDGIGEGHELAQVVKDLIEPDARNWVAFKKFVRESRLLPSGERLVTRDGVPTGTLDRYSKTYLGWTVLTVRRAPLVPETLTGTGRYNVYMSGSNATPDAVFLGSEEPTDPSGSAGARYFADAGLRVTPAACESFGDAASSTNYDAYYWVGAPGRRDRVLLRISKSTGSGGVWYGYELHWDGRKVLERTPDLQLGDCGIDD